MIQTINTVILFYLLVIEVVRLWENWKKKRFFRSFEKCDKMNKNLLEKRKTKHKILEKWKPE